MLKNIFIETGSYFGFFLIYDNAYRFLSSTDFEFDVNADIFPFLLFLALVNEIQRRNRKNKKSVI